MRTTIRPPMISLLFAVMILSGLTGCATGSDLEHLSASVSQRLDVLASNVQAESRRLQAQLDGQAKRQQDLSRMVESIKASLEAEVHAVKAEVSSLGNDTRGALEEVLAQESARNKLLNDLRQEAAQTRKALDEYAGKTQQVQQALGAFSARLDQLPSIVGQVGTEVHALSQTLLGGYRLEEAALRDRLKAIEQVLKHLEPPALHATQAQEKR